MNEETLFAAALEKDTPTQRAAFLAQACGGNVELREKVETLLKAHEEAGSFLQMAAVDRPPGSLTENSAANEALAAEVVEEAPISLGFLEQIEEEESLRYSRDLGCPPLGRLGSYVITDIVGRGGMGVVLKGLDPKLNRVVAIKVMAAELGAGPIARKRFLREAQAAAAVSHDHVVTIHAIDEAGSLPYIVMEYVQGLSLQQRIDRTGTLEPQKILRIARQTALGLAAAHEQGLIHRDVKPANILLENGVERVKLTDFGLARAVDDVGTTQTGVVAGTPQYMSPEQALGQHVDHRSDLFSLGSVMYAMCTGRSPFRGDHTIAVIHRVCEDTPRPIPQVNPEIPDGLVRIIGRLLEKQPERRFQSAREVAELLGNFLAHQQDPSRVPPPDLSFGHDQTALGASSLRSTDDSLVEVLPQNPAATIPAKASGRARWVTAASVLVVLLLSSLGISDATGLTEFSQTVIEVVMGEGTLVVEVDDPSIEVQIDGKEQLTIKGAGMSEVRIRPGQYQIQAVKDGKPIHQEMVTITRNGQRVVRVEYEPGKPGPGPIAAESLDEPLPELAKVRQFIGQANVFQTARFSPDDQRILMLSDPGSDALVFRRSDGQELLRLSGQYRSGAFTPDGLRLVTGTGYAEGVDQNSLIVWDAESGRRLLELGGVTGVFQDLVIAPDGRTAISGHGQWWGDYKDRDCAIRIWDIEEGRLVREINGHANQVTSVAILPDGDRVVSGSRDRTVRIWNVESGEQIHRFAGTGTEVFAVAATPDGDHVLAGFGPDEKRGIRGSVIDDPEHCVAIMWDAESGEVVRKFTGHRGCINAIAVSPDGQRVATASGGAHVGAPLPTGAAKMSRDMTVRLWDVSTGAPLVHLPHRSSLRSVEFSSDGNSLLSAEWHLAHLWQIPENLSGRTAAAIDPPSPARKLLVSSNRGGAFDIYLVGEDGTEWTNLTDHPTAQDTGPAFSPDGTRIAFCSSRSGVLDVWVMNADGSDPEQLTTYAGIDRTPCWSPDGTRIAFVRHMSHDNWDIFVMNADGSQQRNLTDQPGKHGDPAWSPDGQSIAYSFDADGTRLYLMNADGTGARMLSERRGAFTYPAFSPDGKAIVYTGFDDSREALELFIVGRDGSQDRQLTEMGGLNTFASWSPDGKKIAFQHREPNSPGTQATVYIMDADGSNATAISGQEAHIGFGGGRPSWSP